MVFKTATSGLTKIRQNSEPSIEFKRESVTFPCMHFLILISCTPSNAKYCIYRTPLCTRGFVLTALQNQTPLNPAIPFTGTPYKRQIYPKTSAFLHVFEQCHPRKHSFRRDTSSSSSARRSTLRQLTVSCSPHP